jgi:hypothetical protein
MGQEDNLYGGAGPVPNLSLCKLGARTRVWATLSFPERSLCPRGAESSARSGREPFRDAA